MLASRSSLRFGRGYRPRPRARSLQSGGDSASARLARGRGDRLRDIHHRHDEERSPNDGPQLILLEGSTVRDWPGDSVRDSLPPAL